MDLSEDDVITELKKTKDYLMNKKVKRMTKLERLEEEYGMTMFALMTEDGTSEMYEALQNKLQRIGDEIQEERIRVAKRKEKSK